MKKNLHHITVILTITLSCNIQILTGASHFYADRELLRKHEDEQKTIRADAEIEYLLRNSEIPLPEFEDPALWKVLIRQYGIPLFCTCLNIKIWFVQAYNNIKEIMYENPANDETR